MPCVHPRRNDSASTVEMLAEMMSHVWQIGADEERGKGEARSVLETRFSESCAGQRVAQRIHTVGTPHAS